MEERRRDRFARLAGRGREETTPVALHLGVTAAVGLLVGVILAVSLVLWLVLRWATAVPPPRALPSGSWRRSAT